jgi:hypothetical protein
MLKELIKNYPGVTDAKLDNKEQYALVKFDTPDQAKLALSGKCNKTNDYDRTEPFQNRYQGIRAQSVNERHLSRTEKRHKAHKLMELLT